MVILNKLVVVVVIKLNTQWRLHILYIRFIRYQTFQPLTCANLENLECLNKIKRSRKPGDWHLKSGDFQNLCQTIKPKRHNIFVMV